MVLSRLFLIRYFFLSLLNIFLSPSWNFLRPSIVWVGHISKLREVTSIICKLYKWSSLHDRVQIIFHLWILEGRDVTRKKWVRKISQRYKVTYSEALMNSILLLVREIIEHTRHVRYLVVIGDLLLISWRISGYIKYET